MRTFWLGAVQDSGGDRPTAGVLVRSRGKSGAGRLPQELGVRPVDVLDRSIGVEDNLPCVLLHDAPGALDMHGESDQMLTP
jgi:hypothetical protein